MNTYTMARGMRRGILQMGLAALLLLSLGLGRATAAPAADATMETHFMQMMIPHHQGAIEMAELVPQRAQHAELKTLATGIISDQSQEIADMTGWLQSWYNTTPQAGMGMMPGMNMGMMPGMNMGMGDMDRLRSLQGDAFDREFLLEMRVHHQSAVMMAQMVLPATTHPELKQLAENIIRSQNAEIAQFEQWLKAWYNVDVAASPMPGGMMPGSPTPEMPVTGQGSFGALPIAGLLVGLGLLVGGVVMRGWGRRPRRVAAR